MECQIRRAHHVAELVVVGSLDSSWSSYFSDRIDEVVRGGALEILVDMEGVSYLSSNGIGILVRYHRQLAKIGGRFRIVADSEAVSHVLRLTGVWQLLHDEALAKELTPGRAQECETIEQPHMVLHVFSNTNRGAPERLELLGDPSRLREGGYDARDERTWSAVAEAVALGLGALGPDFDTCRGRFGEFLAVCGVAAYRPTAGPGRPDFEQSVGAFVPKVHVLYGMAFPARGPTLARFEAKGEPGAASVSLSAIAEACLEQTQCGAVGLVIVAETEGLVGAALRRSPVGIPKGVHPFAHPDVRDWLSLTPEPEHSRSTALVVGVAASSASGALAPFLRPLSSARSTALEGHFHAAVVPYRPLAGGAIELAATVSHVFEPGRIDSILHLLGDTRAIVGAGESTFTRGAFWYVPLAVPDGAALS
jgi:anti-sigma B factor antagonist